MLQWWSWSNQWGVDENPNPRLCGLLFLLQVLREIQRDEGVEEMKMTFPFFYLLGDPQLCCIYPWMTWFLRLPCTLHLHLPCSPNYLHILFVYFHIYLKIISQKNLFELKKIEILFILSTYIHRLKSRG